ncbi:MAG: SDR family NAD(P)-dependent oxidoreductase [Planctomycetota bacterium]
MGRWNPRGRLAVVTGASSGIGRELVIRLVERDCRVIAVARRKDRLGELTTQCGDASLLVPLAGDITDRAVRKSIVQWVIEQGGVLDLLVNNAGVGAIGDFADATESRLRHVMEVNFFAPAELTRELLPSLGASNDAVICNIGSVLGHRAVPQKSEYCASKFAIHGWSDALRAELAGSSVHVTLVSPSTTKSEFFDSLIESADEAKSKSIGSWTAKRVAKATLSAITKRRDEVVLSAGGKLLVYADRICPPLINWILAR